MFSLLLSLTSLLTASAVYSNCGSAWPVHFSVDPPATVGSGQTVSVYVEFEVPETITAGAIYLHGSAAPHIDMEIRRPLCQYLPCPLTAGTYSWSWTDTFPEGFIGKVQIVFKIEPLPQAGPPRGFDDRRPGVCLYWSAFATGRTSNETNAAIKWLYS